MTKKKVLPIALVAAVWLALAVWSWVRPADAQSTAERRKLAQMPSVSAESLSSGSFMTAFESYTQDQFPLRDRFRTLKAAANLYVLRQLDNNDIYVARGYAAKQLYPLNESQVARAGQKLTALYEQYFADTDARVFFAAVPDKGYYLAGQTGHLTLDFDALTAQMAALTPWATQIDLTGALTLESYYRTDTHWRQEQLGDAAQTIADALGADIADEYTAVTLDVPFYGVYYGQAALPLAPDTLTYLTSDTLAGCTVTNYETGKVGGIYDLDKLTSADLYDVFLSGATPLLSIENPAQDNGKTLVVFRDSFGSTITPLLVPAYSRVIVVDTRYIVPDLVGQFVDFPDSPDVLFLYSALLLNDSGALR
jgi:hypothetical protein